MSSLPDAFLERLSQIVPAEQLPQTLASFSADKPTCCRINTLKCSPAQARDTLSQAGFSLDPVPWLDEAFFIPTDQRRPLTEHPLYRDGALYIQSLSSMTAVMALDPQPGEENLDLCAAPGGKTLFMAARMHNQGRLAAVEAVKPRFFRLKANLQQQGASVVHTYLADGRSIGRKVPARFDRIMLDAPCSSEARMREDDPESYQYWSPKKVLEMARKQKGLIESAWQALKPGGVMLYCTCSFAPEENEAIVQHLLKQHPDAAIIEPIQLPIGNQMTGLDQWAGKPFDASLHQAVRILPSATMDGFFMCRIRKAATNR